MANFGALGTLRHAYRTFNKHWTPALKLALVSGADCRPLAEL